MKLFYTIKPVSSRAFTETVLRDCCGVPAPRFFQSEHGKPYLTDCPLYFNLSHSGGVTALAVCEREVGLDIQLRETRTHATLLRRLTPAEKSEDFFRLWTAKEAYIKYKGGTLANMLSALEYRGGTLFEKGEPVRAKLHFTELEGCAVCVCAADPEEFSFIRL